MSRISIKSDAVEAYSVRVSTVVKLPGPVWPADSVMCSSPGLATRMWRALRDLFHIRNKTFSACVKVGRMKHILIPETKVRVPSIKIFRFSV